MKPLLTLSDYQILVTVRDTYHQHKKCSQAHTSYRISEHKLYSPLSKDVLYA